MASSFDLKRALHGMDLLPSRFLTFYVAPAAIASVVVSAILLLFLGELFTGTWAVIPWGLPVVAIGGVLVYPISVAQRRGQAMDHNMHYFITHLGVLATSRIPAVELFRLLGEKNKEYGPLADECKKVATLVVRWNMGLADACRFTAKRTPSLLFSDFLERFAFGLESGTDIELYLKAEQEVVMSDYQTLYKATLTNIEDIKALFNGAMTTVTFMVMFALMMTVIVGGNASTILTLVVILTLVIEAAFLLLVNMKVPPDPIWSSTGTDSPLWRYLRVGMPLAFLGSVALAVLVPVLFDWPLALTLAIVTTPLVIPGWLAGREEDSVKRRDDSYPAFVRSLGSSTSARGGDARSVLKHLRLHDFGALTENIRDLYTRLMMRLDDPTSWQYFTTESGSRLIQRFTSMYDEAIDSGGRPDDIGKIISDNMVTIVGLRKLRYQQAGTFKGSLYGIAVGTAFSLFTAIGILGMMTDLFSSLETFEDVPIEVPTVIHIDAINIPLMEMLALVILMGNAAMSAFMLRVIDGGAPVRAFQDFTVLVWISNLTALLSSAAMGGLLGQSVAI